MDINTHVCRDWNDSRGARVDLQRDLRDWNLKSSMPLYFVTFCGMGFDCPTLETHQRIDNLPTFGMDIRKYGSKNVIDLYDYLTYNENCGKQVMRRTLHDLCGVFGIDVGAGPEIDGSEVGGYIAKGDYETVAAHCQHDVELTAKLYQRVIHNPFRAVVFDIESVSKDGLDPERVKVDSRLKDPAKIAAAKQEQIEAAALDPFANRIVVLCWTLVTGDSQTTGAVL